MFAYGLYYCFASSSSYNNVFQSILQKHKKICKLKNVKLPEIDYKGKTFTIK